MTEDPDGGDGADDPGHTDEEDPVGEEQPDEAADSRETDTPQEDESLPEETDEAESVSENSMALLAASSDEFTVTNGKLTAYNGPGGNIEIPNTVTEIAAEVFKDQKNLTGVTFPAGLKTIGNYAFQNAFSSTGTNGLPQYVDLTIPASLTSLGAYAFSDCKYLQTVTFEGNGSNATLTFKESFSHSDAFANCTALTEVALPDRLEKLGSYAFSGCTQLKTVTFGTEKSQLTTIGNYAFSECSSLEGITLPNTVTTIGAGAFSGASGLQSATLNDGLLTIGNEAFKNAFSYTQSNGLPKYVGLTIPASLTSLGAYAFSDCKYLQTVTFEDNGSNATLTFEESFNHSDAFANCTALTEVTLPDRLQKLGSYAFSGCKQLKKVNFGAKLETIDNYAFSECSSLEGITLPDTVTTIGVGAFSGASGLQSATLNEGLLTIGNEAFKNAFGYTDDGGCRIMWI